MDAADVSGGARGCTAWACSAGCGDKRAARQARLEQLFRDAGTRMALTCVFALICGVVAELLPSVLASHLLLPMCEQLMRICTYACAGGRGVVWWLHAAGTERRRAQASGDSLCAGPGTHDDSDLCTHPDASMANGYTAAC